MPVYRLLYSLLCYMIFPIVLLRLFWRSRNNASIRQQWQQRLGFVNLAQSPRIWLHAVSVGETIAAKPLVEALLINFPSHKLLISNTTATGFQTAHRLFGERVEHCYFPYDLDGAVSRFLDRSKPALLIVMETEIWPNLLYQCNQSEVPTLIANARLSERSTKGYSRISRLIKPTLNKVSKIACRDNKDIENFKRLGASSEQLTVIGNIKFDISSDLGTGGSHFLKEQLGNCKIWVAASTHAGEDEIILSCFSQLKAQHKNLILVLVPRHPERFESVYSLCKDTGYTTQRRSANETFTKNCEIILGDSMGEMTYWFSSSDVVFLGGSLVETGGHNPLEASIYGVPVVSGPAIFNFNDVYEVLCGAGIAWVEENPEALVNRLKVLLAMPENALMELRKRSVQTLDFNKGATTKLLKLSNELINLRQ